VKGLESCEKLVVVYDCMDTPTSGGVNLFVAGARASLPNNRPDVLMLPSRSKAVWNALTLHSTIVIQKRYVIGVGAGKFWGAAKDFRPNFPKLAPKVFVRFCLQICSHKDFFVMTFWKKVFMCFSANDGHHFLKLNNIGSHFAHIFSFFSDFRQIKTFGGTLAPCLLHHCVTLWKKYYDL